MGVSRIKPVNLIIKADTPEETEIAVMQYWVGYALTCWHLVEQDLTLCYLLLTCPAETPTDGALASFQQIETTEGKISHLQKVLTQVLYQDELTDFRVWAKKQTNRLITLNGKRNKLAHGLAKIDQDGNPVFLPFFNFAQEFRYKAFNAHSPTPSTVVDVQKWDTQKVMETARELRNGALESLDLAERLMKLFGDEKSVLEKAKRMTLDLGIPYAQSWPKNLPPQEQ